jgi:hypothetical protein
MPLNGTAKAPQAKSLPAGAARHMPPAGNDEPLAIGYLFLLQRLLEHLRYRTDRGYAEADQLIADFQADVAAQVEAGNADGRMLAFVGGALHQSKIPASPELASASANKLGIGTRSDRFQPMSMSLSSAFLKLLRRRSIPDRRFADRKRSCHAG